MNAARKAQRQQQAYDANAREVIAGFLEWAGKVAIARNHAQKKATDLARLLIPKLPPFAAEFVERYSGKCEITTDGARVFFPSPLCPSNRCRFGGRPEDWDYDEVRRICQRLHDHFFPKPVTTRSRHVRGRGHRRRRDYPKVSRSRWRMLEAASLAGHSIRSSRSGVFVVKES